MEKVLCVLTILLVVIPGADQCMAQSAARTLGLKQPLTIDLKQRLPKDILLTEGQRVEFVNGSANTTISAYNADEETNGRLLEATPQDYYNQGTKFLARRTGDGVISVRVLSGGNGVPPGRRYEQINVSVVKEPPAIAIDLSQSLPAKLNLVVGQRVTFIGKDSATVMPRQTDKGRDPLFRKPPFNPSMVSGVRFHGLFVPDREGTGEFVVTVVNSKGVAQNPVSIPVTVQTLSKSSTITANLQLLVVWDKVLTEAQIKNALAPLNVVSAEINPRNGRATILTISTGNSLSDLIKELEKVPGVDSAQPLFQKH